MKHLKLFENFKNFFEEIDHVQYNKYLFGEKWNDENDETIDVYADDYEFYLDLTDLSKYWVDFNQEEIGKINNIGYKFSLSKYYSKYDRYKEVLKTSESHKEKLIDITIVKTQDEWFYVDCYIKDKNNKYYRCDQMDGLLECLKKIKNIINETH